MFIPAPSPSELVVGLALFRGMNGADTICSCRAARRDAQFRAHQTARSPWLSQVHKIGHLANDGQNKNPQSDPVTIVQLIAPAQEKGTWNTKVRTRAVCVCVYHHQKFPLSSSASQFSSCRLGGATSCITASRSPSAGPPSASRVSSFFLRLRLFVGWARPPSSSPSSPALVA